MCRSLLIVCVALAACQAQPLSLGDGNGSGGSAAPEDSGQRPSPDDAGRPTPDDAGPSALPEFGEPRAIPELAGADAPDDDPSLSADRLLLCFNSKRDGGAGKEDLWCTSRAQATAAWGTPAPLTALNTDSRETGIALSADGLRLWFSSDRDGGAGGLDVYTSERASRDAAWSAAVRVPELSTVDDDLVSSVDDTGRTLLLARRQDDDDDYDVLWAQRAGPAQAWQAPTPIAEINTDDEESDAFLVGVGLELIFTRDGDLVLARRASLDAPFDAGSELRSLNSDKDDRDAWSDPTLRYVVFSSERDGEHRLYEASR
ncbi:MAG TPA: hypothetical protein VJR89_43200 [Polyangiales bacterium]|nr:hypothetical protein [Polyangiales bacterium]